MSPSEQNQWSYLCSRACVHSLVTPTILAVFGFWLCAFLLDNSQVVGNSNGLVIACSFFLQMIAMLGICHVHGCRYFLWVIDGLLAFPMNDRQVVGTFYG